jgi:hypothetical protein
MAKIFHYRTQSRKKLSIDRIRVTFFLVILCVVFLPLQANSQDTDYGTVIMPSTDPWNFTRYGNVPMNPYTGMQALNIPLYEYNDQDIKIPISLSYASDGMRPNRRAGSMGEGWFLNVGGVITREVRGIPDETYSIDYTGPDGYMKSSQGGYLGVHQNGLGNVSMFVTDGIKPETCYATKNGRFEVTADIFHFNFMGHSGSFILQPDGEVRTLDMSNPEVKVVVHYQRSIAYADMWFELIT